MKNDPFMFKRVTKSLSYRKIKTYKLENTLENTNLRNEYKFIAFKPTKPCIIKLSYSIQSYIVTGQCLDNDNYSVSPYPGADAMNCSEIAANYPYFCTENESQFKIWAKPGIDKCCASCNALCEYSHFYKVFILTSVFIYLHFIDL